MGVLFFASIAHLVPEPDATKWINPKALKGKRDDKHAKAARKKMLLSGLITAVGIAIHNFPEGISVFLASAKSASLGLSLAVSIAMHNIPEGVAVALPVYCATQSKWLALKMTVLSGLAEPLAVVVVGALLPQGLLSQGLVMEMLAAVGGIMAYITMHELVSAPPSLPFSLGMAGPGEGEGAPGRGDRADGPPTQVPLALTHASAKEVSHAFFLGECRGPAGGAGGLTRPRSQGWP